MSVLTIRNGAIVPGVTQNMTAAIGSQTSIPFVATTSIIRITTKVDIYLQLGNTATPPVATSSSMLLLDGDTVLLAVEPAIISPTGSVTQQSLVAILSTTGALGTVSITQLTGYSN